MNVIRITTGQSKKKRRKISLTESAARFVALVLGIAGLIMLAEGLPEVHFGRTAYIAAILYTACLWFFFTFLRRIFPLTAAVFAGGTALLSWIWRESLRREFLDIGLRLLGQKADDGTTVEVFLDEQRTNTFYFVLDGEVTRAVIICAFLVSLIFFLLEFVLRNHFIPYVTTAAAMLSAPFAGISIGTAGAFCLIFFQVFGFVPDSFVRAAAVSSGNFHEGKSRSRYDGGKQRGMPARTHKKNAYMVSVSVTAAAALAVCMAAGTEISQAHLEGLSGAVDSLEGAAVNALERTASGGEDMSATGRVSRGNRYTTGRVKLHLDTDTEATEPLYLIGFRGGDYGEDGWGDDDEETVIHNTALNSGNGQWEDWVSQIYYDMYYLENAYSHRDEDLPVHNTTVTHIGTSFDEPYHVYNGFIVGERSLAFMDDSSGSTITDDSYLARYYEQNEMNIIPERMADDFLGSRGWYSEIESAYEQEAVLHYTSFPAERLPRLTAFVRDHPMTDVSEITAFIMYFLENDASYTMRPGRVPNDEDVVEYFLWTSHRGYCEQFAAAAALMYRMYGIPARYVTGYRVGTREFEPVGADENPVRTDGRGREINTVSEADVTDEDSHAWVEIFVSGHGWVPIDVTPGYDGRMPDQVFNGFDWNEIQELMAGDPWGLGYGGDNHSVSGSAPEAAETSEISSESDLSVSSFLPDTGSSADNSEADSDGIADGSGSVEGGSIKFQSLPEWVKNLVHIILSAAAALGVFLTIRALMIRKWRHTDGRKAFGIMMKRLHRHGLMTEYNGNEPDFAGRLHETVSAVSAEDAEHMTAILREQTFGPAHAERGGRDIPERKKNDAFVRKVCEIVFKNVNKGTDRNAGKDRAGSADKSGIKTKGMNAGENPDRNRVGNADESEGTK